MLGSPPPFFARARAGGLLRDAGNSLKFLNRSFLRRDASQLPDFAAVGGLLALRFSVISVREVLAAHPSSRDSHVPVPPHTLACRAAGRARVLARVFSLA